MQARGPLEFPRSNVAVKTLAVLMVVCVGLLPSGCGPGETASESKSPHVPEKSPPDKPAAKLPPPKPPLDKRVYGEFKLAEWDARLKNLDPSGPDGRAAVDGLLALVSDDDVPLTVRRRVAFKLGLIGQNAVARRQAGAAEKKSAKTFGELLTKHANGNRPEDAAVIHFSTKVVRMLGAAGAPATAPLAALAKDAHKPIEMRVGALEALAQIGIADPQAVDTIIKMLDPPRKLGVNRFDRLQLRREAAQGVAIIGPPAYVAVPHLLRCVNDPDTELQRFALQALGVMGSRATPAGINVLLQNLRVPAAPEVGDAAVDALARIGPEVVPQLTALLDPESDADADDKARAARALAKMGQPDPAGPLTAGVPERSGFQTLAAEHPAAKTALRALDAALDDPDPRVRISAAEAIWRISGKTTSPAAALVLELESPRREVRMQAVRLFKKLGPKAKSAAPGLKRLLSHKNGNVRRAAGAALRAIQPNG